MIAYVDVFMRVEHLRDAPDCISAILVHNVHRVGIILLSLAHFLPISENKQI